MSSYVRSSQMKPLYDDYQLKKQTFDQRKRVHILPLPLCFGSFDTLQKKPSLFGPFFLIFSLLYFSLNIIIFEIIIIT